MSGRGSFFLGSYAASWSPPKQIFKPTLCLTSLMKRKLFCEMQSCGIRLATIKQLTRSNIALKSISASLPAHCRLLSTKIQMKRFMGAPLHRRRDEINQFIIRGVRHEHLYLALAFGRQGVVREAAALMFLGVRPNQIHDHLLGRPIPKIESKS